MKMKLLKHLVHVVPLSHLFKLPLDFFYLQVEVVGSLLCLHRDLVLLLAKLLLFLVKIVELLQLSLTSLVFLDNIIECL